MKTRIYVESSVLSYLTARPIFKEEQMLRQQITQIFWGRRHEWDLCISGAVLQEIRRGDPDAAEKRVAAAGLLPVLPLLPDENRLPDLLVEKKAVPAKYYDDAMHLSLAAVHGIPYLVTWNQKHLDNLALRTKIETVIRQQGFTPAVVVTPKRWMEEMA